MKTDNYRPDVIFMSFDEPNAEVNFRRLQVLAPAAKRVQGVKGIFEAYRAATELATTDYFFVVEADNWMLDNFSFTLTTLDLAADLFFWQSRNAVNDLNWYFGCLKLINRRVIGSLKKTGQTEIDMFLAMPEKTLMVGKVVSETRFNTSPFSAWRSGFRECAKFASGILKSPRAQELLETWQTVGADRPNGTWCIQGAQMGTAFGAKAGSEKVLHQINDWDWLRAQFEACVASQDNSVS